MISAAAGDTGSSTKEQLMSGPVWRVHEGDKVVCNECLRESNRAFAEGEVIAGEFQSERFLCEDCYPSGEPAANR